MPVIVDYFRTFQTFGGPKVIGPASAIQPDPLLRLCISAMIMRGAWCHIESQFVVKRSVATTRDSLFIG